VSARLRLIAGTGVFAATATPYFFDVWWKFIPAIAIVIGLTKLASTRYSKLLGLEIDRKGLLTAAVFSVVTWITASCLIPGLLADAGLRLNPVSAGWAFMPFSQAALEELVFRALLLNCLCHLVAPDNRLIAATSALLFVICHLAFFSLTEGVWLSLTTLVTLSLFGYASSLLFLSTHSIAIPLALHAGWNLVKFGGYLVETETNRTAAQGAAFNAVEGSWTVLTLALVTASLAEWHFNSRRPSQAALSKT
jgi:membrane protease YdiL (CAAX protease family)